MIVKGAVSAWVVAIVLMGSTVHAQTIDDHLREGFALRQRGAEAEALLRFEAAWALAPTPRVGAQLGLTHQALGHWIDAERFLQSAIEAPSDVWVSRNRASLDAALRVIRQRLGEIELIGSPAGASVLVDGRPVGTLPLAAPLRVLAGTMTLEVRADGHVPVQRRLVVDPGASLREEVELARAPDPPPPPPPPPVVMAPVEAPRPVTPVTAVTPRRVETASSAQRVFGIALLSTGGAAMALGVASVVLRESVATDYNSRCPSPRPGLSEDCLGLLDAESTWSAARWIGLAAGGALILGGVSALVLDARTTPRGAWRCGAGWRSLHCEVRF